MPIEALQAAAHAGIEDLAENYIQEARPKIEALRRLLRDHSQLVLGHFAMGLVIEPRDRRPTFQRPDIPKKIDDGAGVRCVKRRIERQRSVDQSDFAKVICHALHLLV